jgi:hypothetical protein
MAIREPGLGLLELRAPPGLLDDDEVDTDGSNDATQHDLVKVGGE